MGVEKTLFRRDRGPYESARFTFVVEGRMEFPFDMLRYDGCWPEQSEDVSNLQYDRERRKPLEFRRVMLRGTSMPTVARWASFGWRVVPFY